MGAVRDKLVRMKLWQAIRAWWNAMNRASNAAVRWEID